MQLGIFISPLQPILIFLFLSDLLFVECYFYMLSMITCKPEIFYSLSKRMLNNFSLRLYFFTKTK